MAVLTASLLSSASAQAVTDRFPAFDLWPTVGDRYFLSVPSSQGLYQGQYSLEISNQYGFHPLDLLNESEVRVRGIVNYYLGHFISAGYGLTDYWQTAVTVPIFSIASFEDPETTPSPGPSRQTDIGDIRVNMKIRAVDASKHRWGLAFEPFVTIPLGADDHFLGYSSVNEGARVIGDVIATKKLRLTAHAGAEFVGERVTISNINFKNRFLSGLGASYAATKNLVISVENQMNTSLSDFFADKDTTQVETLGGIQWDIGDSGFKVGAGAATCGICGARASRIKGFANLSYRRTNENYALREKNEEKMQVFTLGGKTDLTPYEIYELVEKCPTSPDGYQISKDDPRCVEIYELQAKASSCPEMESFDPERDDASCAKVYALRQHDTDKDSVPDFQDRCPTEAGEKDENGCHSKATLIINPEINQILTDVIHFEFKKSTLMPDAYPILHRLAGAIHSQPTIKLISIEGHTDEVGTEEANILLSRARAEVVYKYLVEQGINPKRLKYRGYGKKFPRSQGKSEEELAKNRRVEFIIREVAPL